MQFKTLYEDNDILAIEKPAGVPVRTVAEAYPDFILAHRLDQETSGVLLLAKSEEAYEFLKQQFKGRTVKKIYVAIVNGSVKNDRGVINKPIGRSPKDFRRRSAGRGARGEMREAETFYKVLKRLTLPLTPSLVRAGEKISPLVKGEKPKAEGVFTLLEIRPKTGRTHQIRVHLKYINHPIVGDELYNSGKPMPEGISRLGLHARSIEFKNLKNELIKVESLLPEEFQNLM